MPSTPTREADAPRRNPGCVEPELHPGRRLEGPPQSGTEIDELDERARPSATRRSAPLRGRQQHRDRSAPADGSEQAALGRTQSLGSRSSQEGVQRRVSGEDRRRARPARRRREPRHTSQSADRLPNQPSDSRQPRHPFTSNPSITPWSTTCHSTCATSRRSAGRSRDRTLVDVILVPEHALEALLRRRLRAGTRRSRQQAPRDDDAGDRDRHSDRR